jgi:hypothetical protein
LRTRFVSFATLYALQHHRLQIEVRPVRNTTVFGINRFGDRLIALGLFAVLVAPFVLARI